MTLEKLTKDVQVLAILCNQYGDTGKGKYSDYFAAEWADIIARGTGGANAGHTVVINGHEYIFHLIPAGIRYDSERKINILGNGMVIDLDKLAEELNMLDHERITYDHLKISQDAHVTLPFHVVRDQNKNKSQANGGIGSTGRGIGPTYEDKIGRRGILVGDLFKPTLEQKINNLRENYDRKDDWQGSTAELVASLREHAKRIEPYVCDTVTLLHRQLGRGKKVCLEGAQGLLLSIEHGMHKYATSSDCSLDGTASGVGLSARAVDLTLGIIKFPFMTRVGGGPFTTEIGGADAQQYCADHTRADDLEKLGVPHTEGRYDRHHEKIVAALRSSDPLTQNVAIRLVANEYGATTGRARRIGWTDAVAGAYAVQVNGPQKLILTKADAIAGIGEFNICRSYKLPNDVHMTFSRDPEMAALAQPVYKTYKGYDNIEGITVESHLPQSLRTAVHDFERWVGADVAIVSTGREQQHNVFMKH